MSLLKVALVDVLEALAATAAAAAKCELANEVLVLDIAIELLLLLLLLLLLELVMDLARASPKLGSLRPDDEALPGGEAVELKLLPLPPLVVVAEVVVVLVVLLSAACDWPPFGSTFGPPASAPNWLNRSWAPAKLSAAPSCCLSAAAALANCCWSAGVSEPAAVCKWCCWLSEAAAAALWRRLE